MKKEKKALQLGISLIILILIHLAVNVSSTTVVKVTDSGANLSYFDSLYNSDLIVIWLLSIAYFIYSILCMIKND